MQIFWLRGREALRGTPCLENMKVLLINSPSAIAYANVKSSRGKTPSITLVCLAAYVESMVMKLGL